MTWPTTLRYAGCAALVAGLAACGAAPSSGTSSNDASSAATSTASSSSPSPSGSSSASSSSSPAQRTVTVTVRGSRVTPAPRTVELGVGETMTLTVTSDHADQLHVHGFDIEKELPAGTPVSVELTGESPGVYEVETHHPELRLLKIAVR
nr:cupredoxin domain-containing protein [Phycicoccus sp. 3266]